MKRTTRPRTSAFHRPFLETLEDRLAPATHTWTGAAGDGLWNTPGNWQLNSQPVVGETNVILNFGSTGVGTVTDNIPGVLNIDQINLSASGYTVAAAGGSSIGLTGAANPSIADSTGGNTFDATLGIALTGNDTIQLNGGTDTIAGVASGTGTLTVSPLSFIGGTLALTNAGNTYSGGTVVNSCTLQVSADGDLGTVPAVEGTNLTLNGGTLQLAASFNVNGNRDVSLGNFFGTVDTGAFNTTLFGQVVGSGELFKAGNGTLTLANSGNTYSGTTEIDGGAINVSADGDLGAVPATEGDNIFLNGGTLQLGASFNLNANRDIFLGSSQSIDPNPEGTIDTNGFDMTISSVIAGSGNLLKTGAGTLTLTNTDVFSGDTTINGGTLFIAATGSLSTANNDVVDAGAVLAGNGSVGNIVAVGGTIAPSALSGAAILTAVDADLSQGGNLQIFIKGYTTPGIDYGQLKLTASSTSSTLILGGTSTLTLDLTSLASSGTALGVSTYTSETGTFATVTVTNNPSNFQATVNYGATSLDVTLNDVPLAGNDQAFDPENQPVIINVLANDTGLTHTPITVTIVSQGTLGTAFVNPNNTVTYTPNPNVTGTDTFQYQVKDSLGQTSIATVTVFIGGPTITPPPLQAAPEGIAKSFNLGSFTDPQSDGPWTVSVNWGDNTPATTFSVNLQGTLPPQTHTYASEGFYTLTITVTDPSGGTQSVTAPVFVGGFITALYRDVLNREPDAAGLQSWVTLEHQGLPRPVIATAFWQSPEHRGIEVDLYYSRFLGRTADAGGRANWVNALLSGASEASVAVAFLTSPEFMAKHADNASDVSAVVQAVLNRPATAFDVSSLSSQIDGGTTSRARLVLMLLSSDEAYVDAISDYYNGFLDRPLSGSDLQFWLGQLRTGTLNSTQVTALFLSSPEYLQRALFEANFVPPVPS